MNIIIGHQAGSNSEPCSFLTYTHIAKLFYELRSCFTKIKLNPRLLCLFFIFCAVPIMMLPL